MNSEKDSLDQLTKMVEALATVVEYYKIQVLFFFPLAAALFNFLLTQHVTVSNMPKFVRIILFFAFFCAIIYMIFVYIIVVTVEQIKGLAKIVYIKDSVKELIEKEDFKRSAKIIIKRNSRIEIYSSITTILFLVFSVSTIFAFLAVGKVVYF